MNPATPRLRLRVSPAAESQLRAGHPWLFADSIREQNRPGETGELAVVYDRKDRFLAVGLFDPDSPIRMRVLHHGKPQKIDAAWWKAHLTAALQRRAGLFEADTTGHRWINGESDGWPALVLDRYSATLVLKIYSAAWLPRLSEVIALLRDSLAPESLVLRWSRNLRINAQRFSSDTPSTIPAGEDFVVYGSPITAPVEFLEHGIRFEADVLRGQKTGFFLDQRENRRRVQHLARSKRVLNAFSFSGGFSLHAARGGAASVTDLDISAHALASSARNFQLNKNHPAIRECHQERVQGDTFAWLANAEHHEFDLIILDPPSFARRENERATAIHAYERLATLGLQRLNRGGVMVACSCSAHVTNDEFFGAIRVAAKKSGRRFEELQTAAHPADHPATFPEAAYLKAIYLRVY
ncbi:MAG TPA: class I SAM-dependent methyltransferase [Verrucomicrobiae bacterium]|nr:class I SAM-dependent methyltransferase [Verrucomicrobiae bacterium]